jgi:hypothetical protein
MPTKTCTRCGQARTATGERCPHCDALPLKACADCRTPFHPDENDTRLCTSCQAQERLF